MDAPSSATTKNENSEKESTVTDDQKLKLQALCLMLEWPRLEIENEFIR